jgi:hypothetical protein
MFQVIDGVTFSVSQSAEHPLRRFPADLSVRSQVPRRVSSPFELGEDLREEGFPAFGRCPSFFLPTRNIDPEFQRFGYTQFHVFARP